MGNIAGFDIPFNIDISGWLSSSYIWIGIVGLIGIALCVSVAIMIFYMTYKRKIIIFEEINHELVPISQTRARIIRLRAGGEEVMKTLNRGYYVSAYSQRMGKSSYWFLRGTDGYLYNFVLDSYGKPKFVSGDMRMFNIAIDRLSQQTYGKTPWYEKYAVHMILFVFLAVLIIGMWFIIAELGKAVAPMADSNEHNAKLTQANSEIAGMLHNLLRSMGQVSDNANINLSSTGLTPAG